MSALRRQATSRRHLRQAVVRYVALRMAPGVYTDTVTARLRDGAHVTVTVTVNIVPDPPKD